MKYEDLDKADLKQWQVPIRLSKKLWQMAHSEEFEGEDYWTYPLYECAQHALQLEKLIVHLNNNKKEEENAPPS